MKALLRKIFLLELFAGLRVTVRQFFRPNVTIEYPTERRPVAARFRGVPRLRNHPDVEGELCVACHACDRICPTNCISLEGKKRESGKGKEPEWFKIDYEHCCVCGLCVDPCPTKPVTAIYMSHDYELAGYDREEYITPLDRLHKGATPTEYK